jgi:VIT1/CCC1 family predicted Fe2+/Mn2+ transporter
MSFYPFDTTNADKFRQNLRRQITRLIRPIDSTDRQAIDSCAERLADEFFEAGLKDSARNCRANTPGVSDDQLEVYLEAAAPRPHMRRAVVDKMRQSILKSLKEAGRVS